MNEDYLNNIGSDSDKTEPVADPVTPEPIQGTDAELTAPAESDYTGTSEFTAPTADDNSDMPVTAQSAEETASPDYDLSAFTEKPEEPAEAQTQPDSSYEDVYSSSQPQTQPDASYDNVYSSSQQQAQPQYTNPYSNSAQSYRPSEQANPYSSQGYGSQPYQGQQSYPDGYYHRSFAGDNSGNNINYTAPRYSQPVQNTPQQAAQQTAQQPVKKEKKPVRLTKGGIALLIIVCLLVSGLAGFGGSMIANSINASKNTAASETMIIHKVDTEAQTATEGALVDKTTSEITTEVADTVVEITTEVMQTNSFYGQYIAQGAGSGVIISEDGYIITNNHVIEDASSIKVTTRDGESYDAKLIGADSEVDIAVIKIDAKDLKAAVFGDSSKLNVGSKAVIIGNPLGTLGGSVSEGIISALDRSIVIDGKTMHLMQTDAAINPGNSGGGMFNGQGELSGIVVAKSSSSSEDIDNIGFLIPINNVLDILGDLKDYGYVRGRADTGMSFIDLSNQMYAWYYYGNNSSGVYISSVDSGSNAEQAGFRAGDRVISIDGKEIKAASEIDDLLTDKSVGDKLTFELERNGSKGSLELTLGERKPKSSSSSSQSSPNNRSPFDAFW